MSTRFYYVGARRNEINLVNSLTPVVASGQFYYAPDPSWTFINSSYAFTAPGGGMVMLSECPPDQVNGSFAIATSLTANISNAVVVNSSCACFAACSKPLLAPVTISGTVRGQFQMQESTATNDGYPRVVIYVISRDGRTRRGTLLAGAVGSNEATVSPNWTNRFCPAQQAVTPVACQAGDRIMVEIGIRTPVTGTSKGASFALPQGATDLAVNETDFITSIVLSAAKPWIEFSQDLLFEPQKMTVLNLPMVEPSLAGGGVDVLPPTIDALSPAPGVLTPAQPISFQINDPKGVKFALVYVFYPDLGNKSELVWDGVGFRPEFAGASSFDAELDLTQLRFSVLRNGGWPAPPSLEIKAVDGAGNVRL